MNELQCARRHLHELDQALESYTRAGWNVGTSTQKEAWWRTSNLRERQRDVVDKLEEELRNLLR